jgi:hypothetical protein
MKNMDQEIDRSGLFDAIRGFSQRKLKKVETKVTTGSGELVTEKRGAKGVQTVKTEGIQGTGYVVDNKPDLQVGMIMPGLFICKSTHYFLIYFLIISINFLHDWVLNFFFLILFKLFSKDKIQRKTFTSY